ncbi:E3 ubiquitin-protein ligase TRIM56-like [Biomphalaria glabrata]|uniref:E3 ubiquitin-protein ligase TRIM56-like n=1 Tax=Biomphalaria glabrata TaxID=6526 RepID=A0A9U8EDF7_BIOGL|nr:E3 ubiquitin-protein ligase TRIM56-like [Biomphalaria glabrata]XP_013083137.2 E3 ubiquitin-protein ligase TRIM56-like [Biomphalaria glabrata]
MTEADTEGTNEEHKKWCQKSDVAILMRGCPMMEDRQSDVVPREFLCCPLCQDEYQDPKYLPCLHSFCKACIDDHIEATCNQDRCFSCPVCATEIDLSQEASIELPDNTLVRRLSCPNTVRDKRKKTCGQCDNAGSSFPASVHCVNCDEFLCENCAAKHLDQEETVSHKTQTIDKFEEGDNGWSSGSQLPTLPRCCQYYDALDIGSVYCVDCELCLCPECHKREHDDHRCAEVSAIALNFASKIKRPMKELKKDKKSLQKALASLEKAKNSTFKNELDMKDCVRKRTGMLCNLIKEYETILIMELEKRYSQNLNMIREKEEVIKKHLASIAVVTDLTEKLLVFGSDEEKVSLRRKIGGRVRELCEYRLPSKQVKLTKCVLSEPAVTVESICEMFGELKNHSSLEKKKLQAASHSVDLGVMSRRNRHSISSTEEYPLELAGLGEYEDEAEEDTDMLSESNTSDALRPASSLFSTSGNSNEEMRLSNNSSYSPRPENTTHEPDNEVQRTIGTQEDFPCHNLEEPVREMRFPDAIISECIKGVGVNHLGDIIVGTVSPGGCSKVFILEQHGIIRGQIPIVKNWGIHSISADGKISLVMPRSESKYKVKVMSGDNNVDVLADGHIESFGLNFVTATKEGKLLVAASRYATTNAILGRSGKYGGNITLYDQKGSVERVLTNDTFSGLHMDLFDRPHYISTDKMGNFFVADPGRHSVIGFAPGGDFLFEYGNTDAEEELYQGPDIICTDQHNNVIVFDKKDSRIDVLNYEGHLQRCYFPNEHVRFISSTPDNHLMLVNSEGLIRYFDYI